ncbi:MAG: MlaD family protein [Thermodesulfobacteriota bacterium]
MSRRANRFKIGLFVVVTLLLGVFALIWLGAVRYFEKSRTVAAYFSESVQGLEIDSPLKFRGVAVGRVKRIRMAPDSKLIEVVMNMDEGFKITDDLGVTLNLLGLTGQKYLEMDRFGPDQPPESARLAFTPQFPVIRTYPSNIKEFGTALDKIFRKVRDVDLERISVHMLSLAEKLDKVVSDPKVDRIGADAADTVSELKETAKRLNTELARMQLSRRIGAQIDAATELVQEGGRTVRSVDRLVRRADTNVISLFQKLDRSADDLNYVTRELRKKPSGLLFGFSEEEEKKKKK